MATTCLAVDIGASSGRLIAGRLDESRKLELEEIYRFKNEMNFADGHYRWDIDRLFGEIEKALKAFSETSEEAASIGVDTWGVDYALLNDEGERIASVYAYRDSRTDGTMEELFGMMSKEEIYEKTGIQFIQFNSLYQLREHYKEKPQDADNAKIFLMVPDFLNYKLSGVKAVEYTNATTTQIYNVHKNQWDDELIALTGFDRETFPDAVQPGTLLGEIKKELQDELGIGALKVIAPPTHDTGSAVVAVPAADESFAYISSGTWSLMGIESKVPITSAKAHEYNFTNEGGAYNTYRFLKNIMGLWLIQEVQRMYDYKYSFAQLVEMAEASEPFGCLIEPNNTIFMNPGNMIEAIREFCRSTGQHVPEEPGEIARCIFESLAFQYNEVLVQLREVQDQPIERIHIIGGGCQNEMLNQLCADFTGCCVYAGPVEATAIGNLMVQMITLGEVSDIEEAREIIAESFGIRIFKPRKTEKLEEQWEKFRRLQYDKQTAKN